VATVDCVLDAKARVGEGAVWDDREGVLWWVDIEAPSLRRFDPGSGADRAWPMPSRIGCFAPREGGGFVVALEDGFHLFDAGSGAFEHIADPEPDRPGNRMNDGTVDPRGGFVAGTMPLGPREPVAGFYRLNADRTVDTLFTGMTVSNGSAFSPDGRTFYFSDSESSIRTIWACDHDPDTGALSNRRVFVDTRGLAGRPDGGTVDADGCYWMAGVGGWQLVRFTPRGEVDRVVDMPVERPTKIAFGGAALDTLYVTSIGEGLSGEAAARQPQAGGLFALRVPGATGLPTRRFAG
jgi:L-arabinonolactonase